MKIPPIEKSLALLEAIDRRCFICGMSSSVNDLNCKAVFRVATDRLIATGAVSVMFLIDKMVVCFYNIPAPQSVFIDILFVILPLRTNWRFP